jgi:hypothetical protein
LDEVTTPAHRHDAHRPTRSGLLAWRCGAVVMSDSLSPKGAMEGSIAHQIEQAVASWEGVSVGPHRFGGIEFRVGRRELGHLHGERLADLPFPVRVREQLVAAGRAGPHHIHPESGWVSIYIRDATDVAAVVALFRLNYERGWSAL